MSKVALFNRRKALGITGAGFTSLGILAQAPSATAAPGAMTLSRDDYADRVSAIWYGQLLAVYLTLQFEHKAAAVKPINSFPRPFTYAWIDDDWYYEMCAVRAFEKYGIDMTVDELGQQWVENNCGAWGSSQAALKNLKRGIKASQSGHPRYNRYWWTIGPVFCSDLYGALAPGMPNVAGRMARTYGQINGHAEAVDGAVIYAGAISLGFFETDVKTILRKAVTLVDPGSPYRQCLEMVITMADNGQTFEAITAAIEDRWRPLYPRSNNAVPNGGLAAASLWFGDGDFWKTINLASRAADFSDTDNSAASAIAVIGAMKGMKALPPELVSQLGDRLKGEENNKVYFTPPVDEKISDLVRRTAAIGEKMIVAGGGVVKGPLMSITSQIPVTQPPERFELGDLMAWWNPDWTLLRAGFGGIHGDTYLDGDTLATYPKDEARGLVLQRNLTIGPKTRLSFGVAADPRQTWELNVYVGNKQIHAEQITGPEPSRVFKSLSFDLGAYAGGETKVRLYQRVHNLGDAKTGTAYWRSLSIS